MSSNRKRRLGAAQAAALSFTLAFLLLPICLHAQSDTARIQGQVTDATGGALPGATVVITNIDTNATKTVTSDAAGNFAFPSLQRGNYKADVSDAGFAPQSQSFTLDVSQAQSLSFRLQPGEVATSVTVTDAAPLVETSSSSTGEVIQGRQVTELPLNGRNFTTLALLAPGVTRGNYGNAASGVNGDAETFRNRSPEGARSPPTACGRRRITSSSTAWTTTKRW